jgi:hypothetical protein
MLRRLLEEQLGVLPIKNPLGPLAGNHSRPQSPRLNPDVQSSVGFQLAVGKEMPQKFAAAAANSTGTR